MRAALVIAAALLADPLTAQDMPSPSGAAVAASGSAVQDADTDGDAAALERCLGAADTPESCIGSVAAPCVEKAGGAADGVAACHGREQSAWQARLDTVLARLRDDAAAADTLAGQGADQPSASPDGSATIAAVPRLTLLERAQSAWIAWRDGECAWYASGFDPQAAAAALSECRMTATARRVLTLEPQGRAVDGP